MKRLWPFALVALVSLCLGVVLDEVAHSARNRNNAETFEQRLRCRSLADAYEKKESNTDATVIIEKVDFSRMKRSCIATVTRASGIAQSPVWFFQTLDLVTGDELYSEWCSEKSPDPRFSCGNGRNIELMRKRDEVLEGALSKQ
jgi:hypothetical protein